MIILMVSPNLFAGITRKGDSGVIVDGISFNWDIYADHRVAEHQYSPIQFSASSHSDADSVWVFWQSPVLDITLSISERDGYNARAYLTRVYAEFKEELYLHELYLTMNNAQLPVEQVLKGAQAIQYSDVSSNLTLMPFRDMAAEYLQGNQNFWIIASNYAECANVEGLAANRIQLYDYKGHFFRVYNPATNQTDLLRDTLYRPLGSDFSWSFLFFTQPPLVLDINRWPNGKKAALSITNDADGETLDRLQAVFEGSSDPNSPKYYQKGFFARNIPISSTIFGVYKPILGQMWHKIKEHGNRIGYHTFSPEADAPGVNEQALLTDLAEYDIRMWIDHALLHNPEDVGHYGLVADSPSYVGDVINASSIYYIWPADTHPNNPFNAFDEAWRLPHRVWEAKAFTRPIWFYGRTRMEVWDYTNGWSMLGMKYLLTEDNLDRLLTERGLHICYTHLCPHSNQVVYGFFEQLPDGTLEVRDEVDDMLLMLDDYRTNKGLWIAPVEDIFDRMLATQEIKITKVGRSNKDGYVTVTLQNLSDYDIDNFAFNYMGMTYSTQRFAAKSQQNFDVHKNIQSQNKPLSNLFLFAKQGFIRIKKRDSSMLPHLNISIYNLRGQRVLQTKSNPSLLVNIPFNNLPCGLYLAKIKDSLGNVQTLKFTLLHK